MRVPHVEQIMTARRQHAMDFTVGFVLVGIQHHPELTHDDIKLASPNGSAVASAG